MHVNELSKATRMLNIAVGESDGPFVARYTMERRTVKMERKKRILTLEPKSS